MQISLILHDLRSAHNVGSILRSSDAFGVDIVYIGGYTPYPELQEDPRLPHIRAKQTKNIAKTALGAETTAVIKHYDDIYGLLKDLKAAGYHLVALEQDQSSVLLSAIKAKKLAIIVGREVEGIDPKIMKLFDVVGEIPMKGSKESLNVSVATAIALYHFTLHQ